MKPSRLQLCRLVLSLLASATYALCQAAGPASSGSLKPDVIRAGTAAARVRLARSVFGKVRSVRITRCDGGTESARIEAGAALTVTLPASLLTQPCILRVAGEGNGSESFPLAVADPRLVELVLPAYDPDVIDLWSGQFNRYYGEDEGLDMPPGTVSVGIYLHDSTRRTFILGKGKTAVEYLKAVPSPSAQKAGEQFFYLALPGVHTEDVRWGPEDPEAFWIGVVSSDGKKILEWQGLSEMVEEPSGPLDH